MDLNGYGAHQFICFCIFVVAVSETYGLFFTIDNWPRSGEGDFPNTHIGKKAADAERVRSRDNGY